MRLVVLPGDGIGPEILGGGACGSRPWSQRIAACGIVGPRLPLLTEAFGKDRARPHPSPRNGVHCA